MNWHTLRAVGEGDVSSKHHRPGDLLFRLNIVPHSLYQLIDNSTDLTLQMEMNVDKLRSSFPMNVERLGGSRQGYVNFMVPSHTSMSPGETRTVRLSRFHDYGDLLIELKAKEETWVFNS